MPVFEKAPHSHAPSRPDFAHSTEKTFSDILDYYGIEWDYEPRTFPLDWDEQNNVTEAFTPDFYLPGQDLYIELTSLKSRLVNPKNRKIRRLKELYPEIRIRLVKRRELRDLMYKFGLHAEAEEIIGDLAQPPPAS